MSEPVFVGNRDYYNFKLDIIEKHYNAKFLLETELKNQYGSHSREPVAIFYQETPHPRGSNYFGLYYSPDNKLFICDAFRIEKMTIACVQADNGDLIYSTHNYDFRSSKDGSVTVDGGRSYTRVLGNIKNPHYAVTVKNGEFEIKKVENV